MAYADPDQERAEARKRNAARYAAKREEILQSNRDRYQRLRDEVLRHYGGECVVCGDDRLRALDLEHVNGGGKADRDRGRGYTYLRRVLREDRDDIQVMCGSCHNIRSRGGDPYAETR